MSVQAQVTALKQQLERLFPGKWLVDHQRSRNLFTGINQIDSSITRGITRKKITEWSGPLSSGKTTVLRAAIRHWCAQGLNVAYIDSEGKLYAADWSFAEHKAPLRSSATSGDDSKQGLFWLVRPTHARSKKNTDKNTVDLPTSMKDKNADNTVVVPLISRQTICLQEAVWSADQFIRSNAFDIVILDMGQGNPEGSSRGTGYMPGRNRLYPRLQRSLERSQTALIVVYDSPAQSALVTEGSASKVASAHTAPTQNSWGCHARFNFSYSTINCLRGLNGTAMMVPTTKFTAWREGMSQELEVCLAASVPNRLFAHPRVPDRRTSKG